MAWLRCPRPSPWLLTQGHWGFLARPSGAAQSQRESGREPGSVPNWELRLEPRRHEACLSQSFATPAPGKHYAFDLRSEEILFLTQAAAVLNINLAMSGCVPGSEKVPHARTGPPGSGWHQLCSGPPGSGRGDVESSPGLLNKVADLSLDSDLQHD